MAHFFRSFPFLVTTDLTMLPVTFILLSRYSFGRTFRERWEIRASNFFQMQVCWLDLVLTNSVTKALAATDRYIVLFILGCFIVLMLNTLVSTLELDKVQEFL